MTLTSTRSPRVAAVRRLTTRGARVEADRFVVEGPQAVREALAAHRLSELFVVEGRQEELTEAARREGVEVVPVTEAVLAAMAGTVTPQGPLGLCRLLEVPLGVALDGSPRLVAVLHGVADPGNAGTVLRTADAAGADAVVLTVGSVDPHNAKCVRASAGSLFHLPVTTGPALEDVTAAARAAGLQVLATTGSGDDDLDELADRGVLAAPTAWVFGAEAHGLDATALGLADRRVRVPMHGRCESLNLAAAAAVCLYASARSRRGTSL